MNQLPNCVPLFPHEVPRLARGVRLVAHGRYIVETKVRKFIGGNASLEMGLERALFSLTGEKQTLAHHFLFPRQLAEVALGPQLQVDIEMTALTYRLHDWVRCEFSVTHTGDFFLSAANWRPLLFAIADCPVLEEAKQLREAGFRYHHTASYAHYMRSKHEGHPVIRNKVRLDTDARVNAYFKRFVALFESIAGHGFLPLHEASRLPENLDRLSSIRGLLTLWGEKDLGIALSADHGAVLLPGGKHRLAVARVLGLKRIPVVIRMLHLSWLKTLGKVEAGKWREELHRSWTRGFSAAPGITPCSLESHDG